MSTHSSENLYWLLTHSGIDQRAGGAPDVNWINLNPISIQGVSFESVVTLGTDIWGSDGKHISPTPVDRNKDFLIKFPSLDDYLAEFPGGNFEQFWKNIANLQQLVTFNSNHVCNVSGVWVNGNKQIDCILVDVIGVGPLFFDTSGTCIDNTLTPDDRIVCRLNGDIYPELGGTQTSGYSDYFASTRISPNLKPPTWKTGGVATISQIVVTADNSIWQYIGTFNSQNCIWNSAGICTNITNADYNISYRMSYTDYIS